MRTSTLIFAFLLAASAAFAQEAPLADYSRPTLLRVLSDVTVEAEKEPPIRFGGGAVSFEALYTRWAFLYRPMLPLAGTRIGVAQVWPDAFGLTGTAFATLPHQFRNPVRESEEFLRIERSDRSRVRVTVRPGSQ